MRYVSYMEALRDERVKTNLEDDPLLTMSPLAVLRGALLELDERLKALEGRLQGVVLEREEER